MTANLPLGNERGTGPEMRLTIVSGIVNGDARVSYWPFALQGHVTSFL